MEYKVPLLGDRSYVFRTSGRLRELVQSVHHRRIDASHYYAIASDYLWNVNWNLYPTTHRTIWELHCDGRTIREIAAVVRMSVSQTHAIVSRHLRVAGGMPRGGILDKE